MTDHDPLFDDFLASANAEFDNVATKKPGKYAKKQFTCESCGGSGLWRGGMANKHGNAKCNVCHGTGTLTTSPAQRAKAKEAYHTRKANAKAAAHEANMAHGDGFLYQWLSEIAGWNTFAASLLEQDNEGREWSEKQIEACRRMYGKMQEKKAAKEEARKERDAAAPDADASRILQMFDDALANGKKRRALLAGRFSAVEIDEKGRPLLLNKIKLTPSRAPRRAVWVNVDGEFCGGIEDGKIRLNRAAPEWLSERLLAIAADPDKECRLYGQRTGICSCCGAELTNSESINLGIGPICRAKWGLG